MRKIRVKFVIFPYLFKLLLHFRALRLCSFFQCHELTSFFIVLAANKSFEINEKTLVRNSWETAISSV